MVDLHPPEAVSIDEIRRRQSRIRIQTAFLRKGTTFLGNAVDIKLYHQIAYPLSYNESIRQHLSHDFLVFNGSTWLYVLSTCTPDPKDGILKPYIEVTEKNKWSWAIVDLRASCRVYDYKLAPQHIMNDGPAATPVSHTSIAEMNHMGTGHQTNVSQHTTVVQKTIGNIPPINGTAKDIEKAVQASPAAPGSEQKPWGTNTDPKQTTQESNPAAETRVDLPAVQGTPPSELDQLPEGL